MEINKGNTLELNLNFDWNDVSEIDPVSLVKARQELHHAIQFPAAFGKSYLPPRDDDSHTSTTWNESQSAFLSEPLEQNGDIRLGLQAGKFMLFILKKNLVYASLSLAGKTRQEVEVWLRGKFSDLQLDADKFKTQMHYEIPARNAGNDAAFSEDINTGCKEISFYFANANAVFGEIVRTMENTSEIRCWPHHFDIATLITLDPGKDSHNARSIGVGMSPGDGGYKQPYFYVTPWPYPDLKFIQLPSPGPFGKWHTEGWVGSVLTADQIFSEQNQKTVVKTFIETAIKNSLHLLSLNR